jgi:phospho-N-acetylmuramoyl-pentapeptide-transferase
MGGVIIWISVAITILGVWLVSRSVPTDLGTKLDFLSRNQTWLPFFALIVGSLFGLIDDTLEIRGSGGHIAGGLSLRKRLAIVALVGLIAGSWFYFKLDISTLGFPGGYTIPLGILFIPFFAVVTMAVYSGGVIDGIDGLAGGIFATMFSAYAGIAFYQQQINLSAFCLVVVGAILSFLWFNIPPARFYMSETGTMGLTITLAVVAFMTDSLGDGYGVMVLPIIAMPLVITTLSVITQLLSKKFRNGKKIFLVAPIHHHFEAKGWPSYKVTMRYWIIGVVFAIMGVILALVG